MQEDTFWELVNEAREESGNDEERFLEVLERGLMELPPNAIACVESLTPITRIVACEASGLHALHRTTARHVGQPVVRHTTSEAPPQTDPVGSASLALAELFSQPRYAGARLLDAKKTRSRLDSIVAVNAVQGV